MSKDFEKLVARAAPAIFVVLWSTGFIATKYVLNSAEPLTYLTIRMAVVVAMMAVIVAVAGRDGRIARGLATAWSQEFWCMGFTWAGLRLR